MFCYDLILFDVKTMIVRQVPVGISSLTNGLQPLIHRLRQCTAFLLVVHPGKYIAASAAKDKIPLIRF